MSAIFTDEQGKRWEADESVADLWNAWKYFPRIGVPDDKALDVPRYRGIDARQVLIVRPLPPPAKTVGAAINDTMNEMSRLLFREPPKMGSELAFALLEEIREHLHALIAAVRAEAKAVPTEREQRLEALLREALKYASSSWDYSSVQLVKRIRKELGS